MDHLRRDHVYPWHPHFVRALAMVRLLLAAAVAAAIGAPLLATALLLALR
jgi:hypothetical protein